MDEQRNPTPTVDAAISMGELARRVERLRKEFERFQEEEKYRVERVDRALEDMARRFTAIEESIDTAIEAVRADAGL